ncbi:wiskott-Aldrich syndrome protein family member 2 [Aplysia californica]|uniref:Wiskott-Aldrich syndrome protein family member 2 n=1 Tax=Aplysia californica TaxID=6500 RepID=A0ABM0JZA3_APLCA|nr:wiskott-Aldrich syndrome protein family member 2 [Aplysia californica]
MAFRRTSSQICIVLATLCSLVYSQTYPNLFTNLLASQPSGGSLDPSLNAGMPPPAPAGTPDLSSLLTQSNPTSQPRSNPLVPTNTGFATGLPNALPPNPSYPTLSSPQTGYPNMPAPLPPPNPLQRIFPYLLMSGRDINPLSMLFMGRGSPLMQSPLLMWSFLNNM